MVARFLLLALLFLAGCQSAAVRTNSLPEKFLGTWHDFSSPSYGYRFHSDGLCEQLPRDSENIGTHCEYKALYDGGENTYYILLRMTDKKTKESYYGYQALQLYKEPVINNMALRISSNYNSTEPLLNDNGWYNVNVLEHSQYIKDKKYVHPGFSRSLSNSFFYKSD